METGTLKELNVKPGDVVEMVQSYKDWYKEDHGRNYEVGEKSVFPEGKSDNCGDSFSLNNMHTFRIISRATPTPDLTAITTPFGLLDEATKEALRAHGGPYEYWFCEEWKNCDYRIDGWDGDYVYRVKSIPAMEEVIEDAFITNTGRIIFERQSCYKIKPITILYNRINGEMDLASYRVEPR